MAPKPPRLETLAGPSGRGGAAESRQPPPPALSNARTRRVPALPIRPRARAPGART